MPIGAPHHVVTYKCHTPSRRMPIGAFRQVGHFFNAIHHHDGFRLVHSSKWDIGQFRGAFMMDSVGESLHVGHSVYRFNSRCQELINSFIIRLITHMQLIVKHFKYHIFKSICTFIISFQSILIPYNHFRFIWYTTKTLEIRIEGQ